MRTRQASRHRGKLTLQAGSQPWASQGTHPQHRWCYKLGCNTLTSLQWRGRRSELTADWARGARLALGPSASSRREGHGAACTGSPPSGPCGSCHSNKPRGNTQPQSVTVPAWLCPQCRPENLVCLHWYSVDARAGASARGNSKRCKHPSALTARSQRVMQPSMSGRGASADQPDHR